MIAASTPFNESPTSQSLPPGTRLQEFVIERVLGSGGFGITYLARDGRLGRQVVIKENLPAQFCWRDTSSLTVQPRHSSGEDTDNFQYSLESFEKEAATLASLDHPGIVKVLRSFEANGTAYFVMPFVEGVTFDEVLREREAQHRPFTEAELVALLDKVLAALDYLHERGIYHRDIKPGNLLITASGDPVLIDFGAARQRLSERSLTVIESPGYTPFEQMQSRGKVGPWSDLYALGGTLCKAITGETPPKAADRIMEDEVVPLAQRTELVSRCSQRLLESIDRAMRPKLSERPQSAEEWVKSLRSQVDEPSPKPRTGTMPRLSPKVGDPKGPSHVDINPDWDARSSVPKVAEAVEGKSKKSISKHDLLWLWGGVVVIALMLIGFVSLLRTNSASNTYTSESSKSLDTPTLAAVVPAPAEPSVSDESKDPITLDSAVAGQSIQFEIGQGQKMTLQFCPPGSFMMGSPAGESNRSYDEDQVQVTISKGFWLGQTEVTQAQWRAVMGNNPSHFKGDDLPVETVSWEDSQAFISKLNQIAALPAGWRYELPTEAQWEYACRAGTETPFHFGSVLNGREANCDGNYPYGTTALGPYLKGTSLVGSYEPNGWRLHDMHGNVGEWCADGYVEKLLPGTDPIGALIGSERLYRGGSWLDLAQGCRAASRRRQSPDTRYGYLGFRVAAVPVGATTSNTAGHANPAEAASKDLPFFNGLGMKFVPAGTLGVLFSVWETRVKDFEAFVEETGHDAVSENTFGTKAYTLEKKADGNPGWEQKGGSWRDPRFPTQQTGEHPVVCVSYLDAEAFCAWLTNKERASGKIPATASYRLPTDGEWSRAVGETEFPWGNHWPPNSGDGNYAGLEAMVGVLQESKADFKASAARTAPVGMFAENRFGLHDMGGNVWEWCSTWYTADLNDAETKKALLAFADDEGGQNYRVLRGASWYGFDRLLLRSLCRGRDHPMGRSVNFGFRVVLVVAGG